MTIAISFEPELMCHCKWNGHADIWEKANDWYRDWGWAILHVQILYVHKTIS